MLISAETIQKLADRAAAQQEQAARFYEYQRRGDMESAHFVDLPPEKQQTLLARQDIEDATDAANAGDAAGLRQAVSSAVSRVLDGGAQLGKPQPRVPRRKRGR